MKPFENILFVVNPEEPCALVLERTVALAENNQAALTVVDVLPRLALGAGGPEAGLTGLELQAGLAAERGALLEGLVSPFRERLPIRTRVLTGTPYLEVVREVIRGGHDLVVRPPERPGWLDRLFGSDDMHLLRKCPCPVWLIQCEPPKSRQRILATVDADDRYPAEELETRRALNHEVLERAAALALSEFAELHVASVWDAMGESLLRGPFENSPEEKIAPYVEHARRRVAANLDQLMPDLEDAFGKETAQYLRPSVHLVKGSARREIPALARRLETNLVVMGTVARTGIPGLIMGNTAEAILEQIGCSVLAIKPPGFVTPVSLQD